MAKSWTCGGLLLIAGLGGVVPASAGFLDWFEGQKEPGSQLRAGLDAFERKDYAAAIGYLRPLSEQGNWLAQLALADAYTKEGPTQDYFEGLRWYREAAQHHIAAQYFVGVFYDKGLGVPQDYAEAFRWYRLAAEGGYAEAQYAVGIMYFRGEGVPPDLIRAHLWFNLAGAQGLAKARQARDAVEDLLSPDDLVEAQRLAREWKPSSE